MVDIEVVEYYKALRDALYNRDPDLWNRDEALRQVEDANKFLEKWRQSPPTDPETFIWWNGMVQDLQNLINLVQRKLDGDTTHGVFVSNNPYMIEKRSGVGVL